MANFSVIYSIKLSKSMLCTLVILWCLFSSVLAGQPVAPSDGFRQNQNIIFHRNGKTSTGLPRMNCTDGNACEVYKPEVVKCVYTGNKFDCDFNLPSGVELGAVEIMCEKYGNGNAEFDTCSVDYELKRKSAAQSIIPQGATTTNMPSGSFNSVYIVIFVVVISCAVLACCFLTLLSCMCVDTNGHNSFAFPSCPSSSDSTCTSRKSSFNYGANRFPVNGVPPVVLAAPYLTSLYC